MVFIVKLRCIIVKVNCCVKSFVIVIVGPDIKCFQKFISELYAHLFRNCRTIVFNSKNAILHLLNLHLMLTNEFSHIFLGDVALLLLEPVGQSHPLVLFLLQSTGLLNLIDPSLRIAGLHWNLIKGCERIGDEHLLVVVDNAEARLVVCLVTPVAVGLIVVNLILDLSISFLLLRSCTSKFILGVSVLKEVLVCKVIEDHERIFLTVDSATD